MSLKKNMEENFVLKMRRWTDAIASAEIAEIIPELAEFLNTNVPEKTTNKVRFKLVQHLSHAAYKFDRSKTRFGTDLSRITSLLCASLTEVSSTKKFFSSIYHIIACLLEMKLYREAMEICNYLLPEYNLCQPDETITRLEIYEPTSNLWHKTASNLSKELQSTDHEGYELLASIVDYELRLIRLMSPEDCSRDLLTRILYHTKKIMLKSDTSHREKFKASILDCTRNGGIKLTEDGKSDGSWQLICELIPVLIGRDINSTSIGPIVENYRRYFDDFRSLIKPNARYYPSFHAWERLCKILLRKVERFSDDWVNEIDVWLKEFNDRSRLAHRNVLKSYCYAILQLLTSILDYWEDYAKRKETAENVTSEMMVGLLRLSRKHGGLYGTFEISECRCQVANCRVRTDIANELILKIKCLALIARRMGSLASDSLRKLAIDMVTSSLKSLEMFKAANCDQWNLYWPTWGAAIYNMGVSCENTYPTESIQFYGALITSIVMLEGVKSRKRVWGFEDPLGTILHRLSSVCLKDRRYARAKRVTSMNCLLSHDSTETKAYKDWANIKHKDSTEIETTVLQYLRSNEPEIPRVCVEDYDLVKVCLREIKALQESQLNLSTSIMAVLDELETLKPEPSHYAQGVQLLGYHWLNFEDNSSIRVYLKKATLMYERGVTSCPNFRCAYAAIKFYEFVERTREMTRSTENAMKSVLLALTGRAKNSEVEGSATEYDVVPAYSAINVTITSDLESCLKQAFLRWREYVDSESPRDPNDWQTRCTLHTIKIAGEYSRLYHFESLEQEAWRLTYELANEISDSLSVVYATSRSLTSQNFQLDWIPRTEKHFAKIANSKDPKVLEILTRYKLCLTNFYYEDEDHEKAEESFVRATTNPEIIFMQDFSNFMLLKEIEMKYRLGRDENDDQFSYTNIIIQSLYTLLSMDDTADTAIYGHKEKQLYDYEILLDCTNNLALRMNSLLSYREISAHLAKRLSTAQRLVTSLRVAECLKFLCYIDLSRAKLDDCEAKLQGLEHILEIEAFDATMRGKLSPCRDYREQTANIVDSTRHIDVVRDVGQSDASPVLRKKRFAKPDFMLHGDLCSCFKCSNTRYQYLVFSSTHVRAQLFALQGNTTAAFQHFHGAMTIRKSILVKRRSLEIADTGHRFASACPQRQSAAIEYVMFHLDYCRFLKWSMPRLNNEMREIALDALELCEIHNLHNHPVYFSVNEFLFQCRFEKVFTDDDYSKFMVPNASEMEMSRYEEAPEQDSAICVTPVRELVEKRPITLRRRKTPPFLKLDKVAIDLDDDETATTPTATTISSLSTTKPRRLRRKTCDDEDYTEDRNVTSQKTEKTSLPEIKISLPVDQTPEVVDSSKRDRSKKNSVEKWDSIEKTTDHLASDAVTKRLENLQLDAKPRTRSRKKEHKLDNVDGEKARTKTSKKIEEVTELFHDMSVDKEERSNSPVSRTTVRSRLFSDHTDSRLTVKKKSLSSSALPSDVATSSKNEEVTSLVRRSSARLRKRDKDEEPCVRPKKSGRSIVSESEEDEIAVVDRRPRRRLYTSKE